MSVPLRIEVDPGRIFDRQFTELEQKQLPFAARQAVNQTAFGIREAWKRQAAKVFDRPTPFTVNAILYRKAGAVGGGRDVMGGVAHRATGNAMAEVYIRDEAFKGTPPSKYLLPQVEGGARRHKGMERLLQAKGILPAGMFAVPGRGAQLDQHGNVRSGQVRQILSQLQAGREAGYISNESERSRGRRLRRNAKQGLRGGNYFALSKRRGRLLPGLYERIVTGFGSAVRSIFVFTKAPQYRPRYDIYEYARREWNRLMPFHFNRELAKAVQTAIARGRR